MPNPLRELLAPQRLTEVVDVGANPIDGEPPYKGMLAAGLCTVIGFEPQPEALAALERRKGPRERYLPYAVGDGAAHTLHVCHASGMTSLLEPDPAALELFDLFQPLARVVRRMPVQTRRLDDIPEVERLDFLKIDVQGSELAVFQGGRRKLAQAVVIQAEVSFVTLYRDQPALGEVDVELRAQGFIPHCFTSVKQLPISPCIVGGDPLRALNQLVEGDLVYVRDFTHPERMSDEQLRHLALIAHHCYGSADLALRCIVLLERRNALPGGSQQRYLDAAGHA